MSWLYKFLLDVVDKKDMCTKCHCTTCGAEEFRATLISKLKIYNKIPNITNLSKTNEKNRFIAPLYFDLEKDIQRKIVNEISDELRKLTDAIAKKTEQEKQVENKNLSSYLKHYEMISLCASEGLEQDKDFEQVGTKWRRI